MGVFTSAELRLIRIFQPDRWITHVPGLLVYAVRVLKVSKACSLAAFVTLTMEKTHINLVILSPSQEVNKLTFSSISTATTIGELKEKISAQVATHPAAARQRLIYRGHALVDVGKTLKEVFTQEIVCSSSIH